MPRKPKTETVFQAILANPGAGQLVIGRLAGVSQPAVCKILKRLETEGLIIKSYQSRIGAAGRQPNGYRIKDLELIGWANEALNELVGTRGSYQRYEAGYNPETAQEIADADPNARTTDNPTWYREAFSRGARRESMENVEVRLAKLFQPGVQNELLLAEAQRRLDPIWQTAGSAQCESVPEHDEDCPF